MHHQGWALVHQPGVNLHYVCASANLAYGVFSAQDATHPDDRESLAKGCAQLGNHTVAGLVDRRTAQSASFFGMAQALDGFTADGGVGGNHAIHAMALQRGGDHGHLLILQIRRNFHKHGNTPPLPCRQGFAPLGDRGEQRVERCIALQRSQVLGIGRADVHGHVISMRVDAFQAGQVVPGGILDRGSGVLADVQAQQHAVLACCGSKVRPLHVAQERFQPFVVETKAVDQCLAFGQAEHAWLGVAGLRLGGHGPHLDEAEAHRAQRVDTASVLIQASGQAHAVGKGQARELNGVMHGFVAPGPLQWRVLAARQHVHGEVVRSFGIHAEEKRASEGVRNQGHGDNSKLCCDSPL